LIHVCFLKDMGGQTYIVQQSYQIKKGRDEVTGGIKKGLRQPILRKRKVYKNRERRLDKRDRNKTTKGEEGQEKRGVLEDQP